MHDLFPSITRPARRLRLLSGVALGALFAAGQPAQALVITPSFDASWAAAPAAATTVVNNVIAAYEADFSNPVTVTIAFGWGEVEGSAITSGAAANITGTNYNQNYTLAQVKALYAGAAAAVGATGVLQTANANLPAAYPHPGGRTIGGVPAFIIPDAEYIALTGVAQNADPIQGFTGYATNFCGGGTCPYDFTGGPPGSTAIDFTAVVEHEIAHALGRIDFAFAGANQPLTPQDFFKYMMSGGACTKTLDPNFDITCFSYDGGATNPQGRTFSNFSDSGDWINAGGDSYNYSIGQGQFASVSMADLLLMCAEGWNDRAVCSAVVTTPEPGTLALLGTSLLGLAALRRRRRQ
jgi:PEP-CTERM motif